MKRAASLIGIGLIALCSMAPHDLAAQMQTNANQAATDWAEIVHGGRYVLINNVWNSQAATGKHAQAVFDEGGTVGWRWEWRGSDRWVLAFPEIACGDSPWVKPKGLAPEFPFQAGSRKVTVDIDAEIQADGRLNLSFQLWAIARLPNAKQNITREIMIWLYDRSPGDWSWANKRGSFDSGGVVFDVYEKKDHGDDSGAQTNRWSYVSFVPRTPVLKGTVAIHEFLDFLLQNGMLSPDEYITNVDLGNEIWYGAGTTTLRRYAVTVR